MKKQVVKKVSKLEFGLWVIFGLSLIQSIKGTIGMILMRWVGISGVGMTNYLLLIQTYYLSLIMLILSIGFLLINKRLKEVKR